MAPGTLDCVNEQKTTSSGNHSRSTRLSGCLETVRCPHEENPSSRSQRKKYKHPTPRRRSANGGITSDITRAGTTYFLRSPFEPLCAPQSNGITAPLEPGNNAQLWTPPRHQNIAMRCLEFSMGDPQIAKLILAVLAVGMVVSFIAGYAVRAAISHHRHVMARRSRLIGGR